MPIFRIKLLLDRNRLHELAFKHAISVISFVIQYRCSCLRFVCLPKSNQKKSIMRLLTLMGCLISSFEYFALKSCKLQQNYIDSTIKKDCACVYICAYACVHATNIMINNISCKTLTYIYVCV